jgi:hypothetical protein
MPGKMMQRSATPASVARKRLLCSLASCKDFAIHSYTRSGFLARFHLKSPKGDGNSRSFFKTYTNEGETVLDNCMGSGSTGVACLNTNRNFIGIEKDDKYFEIAKERIRNTVEGKKCGYT